MRFNNKVVVVTGGGRGIGRAISTRFLDEGAVVVTAQRSQSDLRGAEHFHADFSKPEDCAAVIDQTINRHGRLDILVNNAGMMQEARADHMSLEAWDRCMAVNLRAPFMLIRQALPMLRETQGNIVNIADQRVFNLRPEFMSYTLSKTALWTLTLARGYGYNRNV